MSDLGVGQSLTGRPGSNESASVAIIGGGASGTQLASHLLRRPERGGAVVLIERAPDAGLGVAYSTNDPVHLLNVPAGAMSAVHDHPTHFVEWLARQVAPAGPQAFVPRATYGTYLRSVLEDAARESARLLDRVHGDAVDVRPVPNGFVIDVEGAASVHARRIVLAMGNGQPAPLAFVPIGRQRHLPDPWDGAPLDRIGAEDPVALVGTGLTAVDVALSLSARGHRGPIHAISRHGLLPHVHRSPSGAPRSTRTLPPLPTPLTTDRLVRWTLAEMHTAEEEGDDWRDVFNALRPRTPEIWQALPLEERRIFLRDAARHWSVRRHRMAPAVGTEIQSMLGSGRLTVHAGSVDASSDGVIVVRPRQGPHHELPSAWVVNCTGPDLDPARATHPLSRSLLARGLARRDPLGLGFDCDIAGGVLNASGDVSGTLWAIGPLRTGSLWESTAVPEIRAQAAALAGRLDDLER